MSSRSGNAVSYTHGTPFLPAMAPRARCSHRVVERTGRDGRRYAYICRLRGAGRARHLPTHAGEAASCRARLPTEQPAYGEQPRPIRLSAAPIGLELVFDRPGAVVLSVDADAASA
jgi:hypothetical protein